MYKIRCSFNYHRIKRSSVESFSVAVRDGVFNNTTVFPAPPITQSAFQTLLDEFINKYGAFQFGGRANKGPYQAAYTALMVGMDSLAGYVNTVAAGDANIILMSGFIPTKGSASAVNPPAVPGTPVVKRGNPGSLTAEVEVVSGAEFYGCIVLVNRAKPENFDINGVGQLLINDGGSPSPVPGDNVLIFDFNKSRKKTFLNLQVGATYYFYFFAVNANGVSQFSNGASLMCA